MRRAEFLVLLGMLSSVLGVSRAWADKPYHFTFVVDEDGDSEMLAQDIIRRMRAQPPFNRMGNQISFTVVRTNRQAMGCHNDSVRSSRMLGCDTEYISSLGARYGAHRTIAVTSSASGGAHNGIPIITTLGTEHTGIHELLHSYGIGDEYPYTGDDVAQYCNPPQNTLNTVSFSPRRNPFASDAEAKSMHQSDIPWFGSIRASTLITTSNQLGTTQGVFPQREAALYRGGGCDLVIPTWRPYYQPTVMSEGMTTGEILPVYAEAIHAQMSSELGRRIRLLPEGGVAVSPPQASDGRYEKTGSAPDGSSKVTPKSAGAR